MREKKYWTINCSLLSDEEFGRFVDDIESFIQTRKGDFLLPQTDSERWLQKFAEDYSHWRERKFKQIRHPIRSYFKINTRHSSAFL